MRPDHLHRSTLIRTGGAGYRGATMGGPPYVEGDNGTGPGRARVDAARLWTGGLPHRRHRPGDRDGHRLAGLRVGPERDPACQAGPAALRALGVMAWTTGGEG